MSLIPLLLSVAVFSANGSPGPASTTPEFASTSITADTAAQTDSQTVVTSIGYMSHYIGDGIVFGEDTLWTGFEWDHAELPFSAGAFFYKSSRGFVNEQLELYAAFTQEVGEYALSWGAGAYYLPNEVDDRGWDLSLTVNRHLGGLDLSAGARYDFFVRGWFMQSSAGYNIMLNPAAQLYISGGINYQLDYWRYGWRSNDGYLRTSFFWQPGPELNVEVYVARLVALNAVEAFQKDVTHTGFSLSAWW